MMTKPKPTGGLLPSRKVLKDLTGGDPARRSSLSYAKASPATLTGQPQMFNMLRRSRGGNV